MKVFEENPCRQLTSALTGGAVDAPAQNRQCIRRGTAMVGMPMRNNPIVTQVVPTDNDDSPKQNRACARRGTAQIGMHAAQIQALQKQNDPRETALSDLLKAKQNPVLDINSLGVSLSPTSARSTEASTPEKDPAVEIAKRGEWQKTYERIINTVDDKDELTDTERLELAEAHPRRDSIESKKLLPTPDGARTLGMVLSDFDEAKLPKDLLAMKSYLRLAPVATLSTVNEEDKSEKAAALKRLASNGLLKSKLTFVPEHRSYDRAIGLTLLAVRELEVTRLLHPLIATQVGPIHSDPFNNALLELQGGTTTIFVKARTKASAARNLFERTFSFNRQTKREQMSKIGEEAEHEKATGKYPDPNVSVSSQKISNAADPAADDSIKETITIDESEMDEGEKEILGQTPLPRDGRVPDAKGEITMNCKMKCSTMSDNFMEETPSFSTMEATFHTMALVYDPSDLSTLERLKSKAVEFNYMPQANRPTLALVAWNHGEEKIQIPHMQPSKKNNLADDPTLVTSQKEPSYRQLSVADKKDKKKIWKRSGTIEAIDNPSVTEFVEEFNIRIFYDLHTDGLEPEKWDEIGIADVSNVFTGIAGHTCSGWPSAERRKSVFGRSSTSVKSLSANGQSGPQAGRVGFFSKIKNVFRKKKVDS